MTEKEKRGFFTLDPSKLRELSARGGRAAHKAGTAHEFTREEAVEAGRKGGLNAASVRVKGDVS
jgi:uncharacterized protein